MGPDFRQSRGPASVAFVAMAEPGERLTDAAEAFLSQHRGATERTYRQSLRTFESWCASHDVPPLGVKSWHFDLFNAENEHLSPSSLHQQQGVILRFYRYLVDRGELLASPVPAGWRPPRPYRVNPDRVVPASTLVAMEDAAAGLGSVHVALTRLVAELGLLPEAISKLDVGDLGRDGPVVTLHVRHRHGTGHPVRRLTAELAAALQDLVDDRPEGPLFLTRQGNRIDRRVVQRALDAVTAKAAVPRITATGLRLSAAAALIQSGLSPTQVEGLLGGRARRLKNLPSVDGQAAPSAVIQQLLHLAMLLLDESGAEPAASAILSGAALEYHLKQLAGKAAIAPSSTGGIAALASSLRSAEVITKQERKAIEAWGGLRNDAVHGDFHEVTALDARHFHEALGAFVQKHPV